MCRNTRLRIIRDAPRRVKGNECFVLTSKRARHPMKMSFSDLSSETLILPPSRPFTVTQEFLVGAGLCNGWRTHQRTRGNSEVVCRFVPASAIQQPCDYGRSGFPSRYGSDLDLRRSAYGETRMSLSPMIKENPGAALQTLGSITE
jgi:hypothetical protein